jgi:hypothetical protein
VTQLAWPDFVFDSSYHLLSLEEVEKFIIENHHLPGIPSASTVEEEGVCLGDVQSKLLQKIEELTLYCIVQQKLIKALESRLTDLEKE